MKLVRFLGPKKAVVLGGKTLERGGEPVELTEAEYATLKGGGERWQHEIVQPGEQDETPARPARAARRSSRKGGA